MARNFHVTNRPMSGGSTSTGSHGANSTRPEFNSSVLEFPSASVRPNLGSANASPFIHHRYEIGAAFLWLLMIVGPWIVVWGLVVSYKAIIPYFIQY